MSDRMEPGFYSIKSAPLIELLNMEKTKTVQGELEKRAVEELQRVFQLYQKVFGDSAAEIFSEDAASLFVGNQDV